MQRSDVLFTDEIPSDAFVNNIVRLEILHDGGRILTSFNSQGEMTAQSVLTTGKVANA